MKGDKMYWYVYKCKHSGKDGRGHKKGDKPGCGMPQIRKVKNIDLGVNPEVSILGSPCSNCGKKTRFGLGDVEFMRDYSMFSMTRQDTAIIRRRTLHRDWFNEQKRMEKNLKQNPHGYAQTDNETPNKIEESIRSKPKLEKKSEGVFSGKYGDQNAKSFESIANSFEEILNNQNPTSEVSE
jgi:hypothetical protein